MTTTTLQEESIRQGNFYVPQFEIKIQGVGLPRDVLRDVTQVTYKDNIKEIDGFELTVNNWDPDTMDFKYVGSETAERLAKSSGDDRLLRLFEPCGKEVEVWMGYLGDLRLMVKGTFTTMEPNFPSSGAPTLSVRGVNVLHQLRRKQYSTTWGDKRDSEIAKNIAALNDKELGGNHKRFPLPIVINPNALAKEDPLPYVAQQNQYDIDFLLTRARRLGYVVYVREGDPQALTRDEQQTHLYFGPSDGTFPGQRDVTFKLKWGISIIDFKPTLTTANQVRSVTVNGWDRARKKAISVKVSLTDKDKDLKINQDLQNLLQCDPREDIVVDKPVFKEKDAKDLAKAILRDRLKEMVKASGTCIGLADLRAGKKVEIEGFGSRFNGTYFITESTHTISDSGYITKFNARRESTGLPRRTAMKEYGGVVVGIVKEVDAAKGQVKVDFPWMTPAQRSHWAPIAGPMSGKKRGFYFMPEIDDEVVVAFEHGQFDHPLVIGFVWNGEDNAPEATAKNRIILTPGGHTLRFEDADGQKKVILRSSSGQEIILDDKDQSIQMQGGGRILALRNGQVQIS